MSFLSDDRLDDFSLNETIKEYLCAVRWGKTHLSFMIKVFYVARAIS
jgi:hypothetical protein